MEKIYEKCVFFACFGSEFSKVFLLKMRPEIMLDYGSGLGEGDGEQAAKS